MLNVFLIILIISSVIGGIYYYFKVNKNKYLDYDLDEDRYRLDIILEFVKNTFNDILKTNLYAMNITREEFEKKVQTKNELRKALKTCIYGDINAKN